MKVMRRLVRIGLFVLVLLLGTMSALAVGEARGLALASLNTAPVHSVTAAANARVIYAGLAGGAQAAGIYRSDDGGRSWQLVSSGPGETITALAVHPAHEEVVFAGSPGGPLTSARSLWRSDDGGRTWLPFPFNLPATSDEMVPAVTALAVDARYPHLLYIGTDGQGVYRFDGERNSYQPVGGFSLAGAYVKSLTLADDGQLYAITNAGLFVNQGADWQLLATPDVPVSLALAPRGRQVMYLGTASTGLYRSTDAGRSWEPVNTGLDMVPGAALRVTAVTVDRQDAGRVVAATAYGLGGRLAPGGVFETWNAGETWTKLADSAALVTQLTLEAGTIYAATSQGLVQYGRLAARPVSVGGLPGLQTLASPNGLQVLILLGTLILAGLILVGRREWLARRAG